MATIGAKAKPGGALPFPPGGPDGDGGTTGGGAPVPAPVPAVPTVPAVPAAGPSEESRKERTAAAIMATLKPPPPPSAPGGGSAELIAAAATAGALAQDLLAREKAAMARSRKRRKGRAPGGAGGGGGGGNPHAHSSRALAPFPFAGMDDSEFVRSVAAEFRRRGYTVALQLAPAQEGAAKGTGEDGAADGAAEEEPQVVAPDFQFYPSAVATSRKSNDCWNMAFEQLKAYHAENGGALPLRDLPNNPALSKWAKTQLTLWRRMKKDGKHNLSLDRIRKLQTLDLEASAQMEGSGDGNDGEGGGEASEPRKRTEPTGKNRQKWQDKFEELRRYKEERGDCNVARSYNDTLSKWCNTQRVRCKAMLRGETDVPMTREQFQALEGIGFNMSRKRKVYDRSVLDRKWEEKYQELLDYKEKFGNVDVAVRKGFEAYKQLANWAGLQRQKYKAKQTGTKTGRTTGITDYQIKKLASVGFSFTLQDDFETRFKNLVEFKKEFGHTKVPVFYTGYNNLGRWAKRMRDGIRNEEPWMDDVRKTRLLGIDFDIAARRVFGHPKKKPEEEDVDDAENREEDVVAEDPMTEDPMAEVGEMVEAQAVAAATTMARMDNNDFGRTHLPPFGNFFYQGYHQG